MFAFTPYLVWKLNYIDETISVGEKYGFVIGDSKQVTFNKIKTYSMKSNYKAVQIGDDPNNFEIVPIDKLKYSIFLSYNTWVVMLDSATNFLNIIRLDFKEGKLSRLHRHKMLFELP